MDMLYLDLLVHLPLNHRLRCLGQHLFQLGFFILDFFLNNLAGACWLSSADLFLSKASVRLRLILILIRIEPSIIYKRQLGKWLQ